MNVVLLLHGILLIHDPSWEMEMEETQRLQAGSFFIQLQVTALNDNFTVIQHVLPTLLSCRKTFSNIMSAKPTPLYLFVRFIRGNRIPDIGTSINGMMLLSNFL